MTRDTSVLVAVSSRRECVWPLTRFASRKWRSGLNGISHPDWVKFSVELNSAPKQNTRFSSSLHPHCFLDAHFYRCYTCKILYVLIENMRQICLISLVYYYDYLLLESFSYKRQLMVFHWSFEWQWQQVSSILLDSFQYSGQSPFVLLFPSPPVPLPILRWLYQEHQLRLVIWALSCSTVFSTP